VTVSLFDVCLRLHTIYQDCPWDVVTNTSVLTVLFWHAIQEPFPGMIDHSIIFPSEHYSYRGVGDLTIIILTGALAREAGWVWLGALVNRLVTI
jgi:hypothetical protein